MTDTLTFTQPFWLFLLIALIPLLALRARSQRFREVAVAALVASRLRDRLVFGHRAGAHWGRFTLQLLALSCLLFALAGPRYGFTEEETFAEGRNIIIGIDTSRSMLADDLKPNRMTRAKLAALDLIGALPSDRIGLIAFAGTSFLQAPLTVDHEAVIESITHLDTEVIPRGGTNISRAVALARDTFKDTKSANNALILFTDGEDLEGSDSIEEFQEHMEDVEMTVVSIGVGTSLGAIIPDPDPRTAGDFIRDNEGNIVRSRLEDAGLKSLARQSKGLYLNLNSTAAMQTVVKRALDRLEKAALEGRTIHKPIDRYRWALVPGILFLLISLVPHGAIAARASSPRRLKEKTAGTTTVTAAIVLLLAAPALIAANAADAYRKYKDGEFEEAVEAYEARLEKPNLDPADELQYGAASAAFKMGDFEKAIESYGEALLSRKPAVQEKSHYSLGNALYREGEARIENPEDTIKHWRNAVSHYEAALALNESNEDTRFNLDFVQKRLEELEKQQQQQQQQQDQEQQQEQQDQSDQNQENSQDQKGSQNQDSEQQSDSNENQQEDSSGNQEQKENDKEPQDGDQNEDQEGGENEKKPENEPETPEGDLEAKENPAEPKQSERRGGEEEKPNPETGFTRSQARQILRSLADEDLEVRPLVPPSGERVFKNW